MVAEGEGAESGSAEGEGAEGEGAEGEGAEGEGVEGEIGPVVSYLICIHLCISLASKLSDSAWRQAQTLTLDMLKMVVVSVLV